MRIAVIADTHLPRGGRRLPELCVATVAECDLLLHAGDFVTAAAMRELAAIGPPLEAVHGNVDEPALQRALPAELTLELGGHRLAMVHDAGPRRGRLERLRRRYPQADVVVFGHSHMPLHEERGGFHIFNPGSPTERRRAPERTMGVIHLGPGAIGFEHISLR